MTLVRNRSDLSRASILHELDSLTPSALLTPREAAAYLRTSTGVLANWRSLRRGPRYHGANDFIRYRLADLDQWVTQRAGEVCGPEFPSTASAK